MSVSGFAAAGSSGGCRWIIAAGCCGAVFGECEFGDPVERTGGSPAARKQGRPAGKGPLADHLDYLVAAVEAKPDITMPELAGRLLAECGMSGAEWSLSRLLRRAGFTYKKTADGIGVRTRRCG
jgi:hypothetical protein